VAAEPLNHAGVPVGRIQGGGDPSVAEAMGAGGEAHGVAQFRDHAVHGGTVQAVAMVATVQGGEEGAFLAPAGLHPCLEGGQDLGGDGEAFPLGPALAHHGEAPGLQVHVGEVQGDHLPPAEGHPKEEAQDGQVPDGFGVRLPVQDLHHLLETIHPGPRVSR